MLHAPLARIAGYGWKSVAAAVAAVAIVFAALSGSGNEALAGAIVMPAVSLAALWFAWRLAGIAEVFVAGLFGWRGAVDRLEFVRLLQRRAAWPADSPPARPYGPRLAWRERLRAIREARKLEERELAQGLRPPVPRVSFSWSAGTRPGIPRLLWIGFWVLFALARVAHLVGAPN